MSDCEENRRNVSIGSGAVGAVVGAVVGGPIGALIGAAICSGTSEIIHEASTSYVDEDDDD